MVPPSSAIAASSYSQGSEAKYLMRLGAAALALLISSFIAAAVAGMIAYGVMSLVMTATPIAMLDCGHEFAAAAFVIQ